jgi:DNA replication factor GINS
LPLKLENLDFRFENSRVKVIANRNYPEMKLAGLNVGPFQEGNEYEVYNWVAQLLAAQGIAHFREEDNLDATKLYKVQWKERVQVAGQISELPENFYPKLRRYLKQLKRDLQKQPEKITEYQKTRHLADDIVNSRLRKIVTLSSGPIQAEQILNKLTIEEQLIYMQLAKDVNHWRSRILEHETEG